MSRTQNFTFTHNNYPDTKLEDEVECSYIIYGKEVGESGTPHLQGFIRFPKWKSLKQVIKILPGCHIEEARSVEASITYCKKEGNFTERGNPPMSQKRKGEMNVERWDQAKKAAREGRFDDIPSEILIKHLGNLKKLRTEVQRNLPILDGELKHQWIYGKPGTGKTSRAHSENPGAYIKGLHTWWDGYDDHETVIIDDMSPYKKVLCDEMKTWADRYPFQAQIKGTMLLIRPKLIVVTSNYCIDEVWEDETTRLAMHRRFTEIYVPSNLPMTDFKTIT